MIAPKVALTVDARYAGYDILKLCGLPLTILACSSPKTRLATPSETLIELFEPFYWTCFRTPSNLYAVNSDQYR